MPTKKDLQDLFAEYRPVVEQELDGKEITKGLREVATNKGIDWSAFKALSKARVQDERDVEEGKEAKRVSTIVERADFAQAYAGMLGFSEDEREVDNRSSSERPADRIVEGLNEALAIAKGEQEPARVHVFPAPDPFELPEFLDRRKQANA